jgi:hypothetical protein
VAQVNRRQSSLHTAATSGLSSLVKQVAQGFVGLLAVLLLAGGAPSGFMIGLTFCLGVAFIAWQEKQRAEEVNPLTNPETLFQEEQEKYSEYFFTQIGNQEELLKRVAELERAIAVLKQDQPQGQDSSLEKSAENLKLENNASD